LSSFINREGQTTNIGTGQTIMLTNSPNSIVLTGQQQQQQAATHSASLPKPYQTGTYDLHGHFNYSLEKRHRLRIEYESNSCLAIEKQKNYTYISIA